jgi:hypothetical protein
MEGNVTGRIEVCVMRRRGGAERSGAGEGQELKCAGRCERPISGHDFVGSAGCCYLVVGILTRHWL